MTENSKENSMSESASDEAGEDGSSQAISSDLVLIPETVTRDASELIITQNPSMYTYQNMMQDGDLLLELYPQYLTQENLGTTADGRQLRAFRVGSVDAPSRILINAGIHAREYITCQLVMKQLALFLKGLAEGESYNGRSYGDLLQGVCIYVIPMVNPDGMSISQFGMDGVQTEAVRNKMYEIAAADGASVSDSYYLRRWKANANGVDLNRNFDAMWDSYGGSGHISSDHYKGAYVGCEAESAALINLTVREDFSRTISYHTQGSVIYWYFAQEEPLLSQSKAFARRIGNLTGYSLDANYEALDPAGYKDWGIMKLGIPGLTIEVGYDTSPVPADQFPDIWRRNQYVWQETLLDLREN